MQNENEILPNPECVFPKSGVEFMTNVKPSVKNPNIVVGDFTYFSDRNFEKHVTHHYDFIGDRLVIGKFCQIAAGVEFVMNGANHQMNAVSTFPFYVMDGWNAAPPATCDMTFKGDTVIGNDVWIGQNATILPGVHVGDGAIIGCNSVVANDVPLYTIVAGNPAQMIRRRFDDELISMLEKLKWWDLDIEKIRELVPLLSCGDLAKVKSQIAILMENV